MKSQAYNRDGTGSLLGTEAGVRVFAPTRNGRVLSQLRYLPISKTMLIDQKLSHDRNAENFDVVVDTYSKLVSMDHFASDTSVSGIVLR